MGLCEYGIGHAYGEVSPSRKGPWDPGGEFIAVCTWKLCEGTGSVLVEPWLGTQKAPGPAEDPGQAWL